MRTLQSIGMLFSVRACHCSKCHDNYVLQSHSILVFALHSFLGQGIVNAPLRTVGNFVANIESTYALNNTLVVSCNCILTK